MSHVAVLGAEEPITAEKIPSGGPLALLPVEDAEAEAALGSTKEVLIAYPNVEVQVGLKAVTEQTKAVLWFDSSAKGVQTLDDVLTRFKNIGWVQLPMAGITHYLPTVQKHADRLWTSAKVRQRGHAGC